MKSKIKDLDVYANYFRVADEQQKTKKNQGTIDFSNSLKGGI